VKKILKWGAFFAGVVMCALTVMIAFGAGAPPPPMRSITHAAAAIDRSDLPPVARFLARDGQQLAYRVYPASPEKIAILIHGSAGNGTILHPAAKALRKAGITAFTLDMRGHGESGKNGDVRYIGQLEDDLADFVAHMRIRYPRPPITLIGHSLGGGFALRVAASPINHLFNRYILLAPYLRFDAPTTRGATTSRWSKVFIPRLIGLQILHALGIDWFSGLPVMAFALPAEVHGARTYSYRLLTNFAPDFDYLGDFRRANAMIYVLVGKNDEVFFADKFASTLAPVKQYARVEVIPGLGHMALVTDPVGLAALVKAYND
jgi:pimeloyl-ACP methyl ester carboxylesterase